MSDYNTEMDNIKEEEPLEDRDLLCKGCEEETNHCFDKELGCPCLCETFVKTPIAQWYIETDQSWQRLNKTRLKFVRNGRICGRIRENPNMWGNRWFFNYQREKEPDNKVLPADTLVSAKENEKE